MVGNPKTKLGKTLYVCVYMYMHTKTRFINMTIDHICVKHTFERIFM